MRTNIFTFIENLIVPSLFVVIGLFVWHAAVTWFGVPEFILPSMHDVLAELASRPFTYSDHARSTLSVALTGYLIAIVVSVCVAGVFTWSRPLERGLYPYILTLKITPTVAIAPLLVIWFGVGVTSKIITVVLICFFPIFISALKGLRSVDTEALHLFRSLNATPWQIMRYLRLRSALPYIFPALKVTILFALTGTLLGELIASNKGLGYMTMYGLKTYNSTITFAATLTLICCGYVLFLLVHVAERHFVFWHKPDSI